MSKISWFIKEDDTYTEKREYHAGTYRKDEKIKLNMQVWNNRWGVEDADNIINPIISFRFDSFEDSTFLSLCKVIVNERLEPPVTIKDGNAIAVIGEILLGKANDGDETSYDNRNNFMNITIEIDTKGKDLKENDLKKLYIELLPLS